MSIHHPIIGVTCCLKAAPSTAFHGVGEKYVDAVVNGAKATPLLIPAIGDALAIERLLATVDGLLFTGSPSNVDPDYYGGPPPRADNLEDKKRDATTLPLIRRAIEREVPIFGICRGIQEINVALGGSLHQHNQEQPGRFDHRSIKTKSGDERYEIVHQVKLRADGLLQSIVGKSEIGVNSLHGQAIDRLADDLVCEAEAPDGTIEAVSHKSARGFFLAVQWHPEFRVTENPDYLSMFEAFAAACRQSPRLAA